MKSVFAIAALAACAVASHVDFVWDPTEEEVHSHCAMDVTFSNTVCASLWIDMREVILGWTNGDHAGGLYAIKEDG